MLEIFAPFSLVSYIVIIEPKIAPIHNLTQFPHSEVGRPVIVGKLNHDISKKFMIIDIACQHGLSGH